ncbi:MAG: chloride channel protein [Sediminibacterium sp.]|jgi:H+/Cl- antiporter ClcA|nr:chloride channel protein [Sediminibacterium sp.]
MSLNKFNTTITSWLKWLAIYILIGSIVGTATAFFLQTLDDVTQFREEHVWVVYFLPIAGLVIGLLYYYYGESANKGNNLIIETHHSLENEETPKPIPFKMAPMVFLSTLLTHIAGGSAGREGTAVQMGGAIADQFTRLFKLNTADRKILLIIGISSGFAAVFGTPLAGAFFAIEILSITYTNKNQLAASLLVAYIAHYSCLAWQVKHTIYSIPSIPTISLTTLAWAIIAGILFGLTALAFTSTGKLFENIFNKIKLAPLRPFIGGIIIALFIVLFNSTKFIGLGIPSIQDAFINNAGRFDFAIKLILTSFTLSAGFKGGEVTPLFFIGATLGNILIWFIPLPMALLAGMGFVAVFSGATNCVFASIALGLELFGMQAGVYVGLASVAAYFTSGPNGIYSAKYKSGAKYIAYNYFKKIAKL